MSRNQEIIKTSRIGIAGNIGLCVFKLALGTLTHSIAITLDGINNLTDAVSFLITIIGTRLSEKEPDRNHPFGHGRVEYLTSLLLGAVIFLTGLMAFRESVQKILHPEECSYSAVLLVLVGVCVLGKIAMGIYTKRKGRELKSAALTASGKDSLDDSIESAATLICGVIYVELGINIAGFVGLGISLLIIRTGLETIHETVSSILGERIDIEIVSKVRESILSFSEVDGVFNIMIHNYGRERLIGSAHIEVPDVLKASWIDNLQRAIRKKVLEDTGVEMFGITIYAENSRDPVAKEMLSTIRRIARGHESVEGAYGFYLDKVDKTISFEVMVDYDVHDIEALREEIREEVRKSYPEYRVDIAMTRSF